MPEQILIFDTELKSDNEHHDQTVPTEKEVVTTPYVGQKAKIKLPEDKDSEEYQYLHFYCSSVLTKVGEIKELKMYPSGNYTCTIDFFGETRYLNPEALYLL
ncbi:hypothetical protein [Lysinibacillus xylanilyticus]|uniref:Uncharacterized protein n=1 Tax=Lysinibacillus xylanilyticus TaxID=582475 RepID=A0A2M9Q5P4_9BACI|nr:hypothetical protein [Lysinibacillus xylanilyticus]PJO43385.1 hypothetical protein CWD94_12595 [Lysinibacillus xylanilyticus]